MGDTVGGQPLEGTATVGDSTGGGQPLGGDSHWGGQHWGGGQPLEGTAIRIIAYSTFFPPPTFCLTPSPTLPGDWAGALSYPWDLVTTFCKPIPSSLYGVCGVETRS